MKKQNDNPLLVEVRDAVLELEGRGQRWQDQSPLVLTPRQPQRRSLLFLLPAACGYQTHKILVCEHILQETLVIYCDTPLSRDPSIPLSTCVPALMLCWGSLALTQSRTLSHCSGLWPGAPPGRMASLLNHNPVILPELSFQKAQPSLCAAPTRSSGMSPDLCFFLSLKSPFLLLLVAKMFFFMPTPHWIEDDSSSSTLLLCHWPFNPHVCFNSQVAYSGRGHTHKPFTSSF